MEMQSSRKVNSAPVSSKLSKKTSPTPASDASAKKTTPPASNRSTPKKKLHQPPPQELEFLVTGKQIFRRNNRAYSLPVSSRHPSLESLRISTTSSRPEAHSRDLTLDDVSLELSQDSLDCVPNQTFTTSTPKFHHRDSLKMHRSFLQSRNDSAVNRRTEKTADVFESTNCSSYSKIRQETNQEKEAHCFNTENIEHTLGNSLKQHKSIQSHASVQNETEDNRSAQKFVEDDLKNESMFSCSTDDSVYQTSSNLSKISCYRYNTSRSTDLDFSSASPEDSGQSSDGSTAGIVTASSHKLIDVDGEWGDFWTTYNSSRKPSCDQCLTELTKETHQTDLLTELTKPITDLNTIKTEGIILTRTEAKNIIDCAQTIGDVLSRAMERSKMQETEAENTGTNA